MLKLLPLILALSTNASALSYTSHFNLAKPTTGDTNYVTPFNVGMDTIDTQLYGLQVATSTLLLPLTGGTLTGPLTLAGSSLTVNGANVLFSKPTGVLDVVMNSADNTARLMINSASGESRIETATGNLNLTATAGYSTKVTGNSFSVGTSTFVITGGKVGVGTNSPAELVHAVGSFRADAGGGIYANFAYNTARAYGTDWYQDIGTVGKHFYLRTSNAGSLDTTAMTVLNTGSVGIGTASPASKLHVSSGTFTLDGTGSPTAGFALCFTAAKQLGHCTAVTAADGSCTCVTP